MHKIIIFLALLLPPTFLMAQEAEERLLTFKQDATKLTCQFKKKLKDNPSMFNARESEDYARGFNDAMEKLGESVVSGLDRIDCNKYE